MRGVIMVPPVVQEAEELRKALTEDKALINVSFSRETAEFISQILDAKAEGKEVLVTKGLEEVSPTEAASILGVSRPQVRKIMDSGALPFRMVGAHHRIAMKDLQQFMLAERARQEEAMRRLVDLENELGLFD